MTERAIRLGDMYSSIGTLAKSMRKHLAFATEVARLKLRRALTQVPETDVAIHPIDVLYLWADIQDPGWMAKYNRLMSENPKAPLIKPMLPGPRIEELKYSLRSIDRFLQGFRHVYLVTDSQVPDWLNQEDEALRLVDHKELFPEAEILPTFNTQAIESYLYRIPTLADHFIYFNDDMFLQVPMNAREFFAADGGIRVRLGRAISPKGAIRSTDSYSYAAHRNSNRILDARFGVKKRLTTMHRPYAHRKDLLRRAESAFREEFVATRSSQFRYRSNDRQAIHNFLLPYWAAEIGEAELIPPRVFEKDIYRWVDDVEANERTIRRIRRSQQSMFCIDATGVGEEAAAQFHGFMELLYPGQSRFER